MDGTSLVAVVVIIATIMMFFSSYGSNGSSNGGNSEDDLYSGPYKLIEKHTGNSFLDYYDFYVGADSPGSAGMQTYVSKSRAEELGLINISGAEGDDEESLVTLSPSLGTSVEDGNDVGVESFRLEGKTKFDRGLIILDARHVPTGCGSWPAFWTTDGSHWPEGGEIDIAETYNGRRVANTAMHASEHCTMRYTYNTQSQMYSDNNLEHNSMKNRLGGIPLRNKKQEQSRRREPKRSDWTGSWEQSMPIPDWYIAAGLPLHQKQQEFVADNCWVMAPYDWANQGCVINSDLMDSVGPTSNAMGGAVYVLEWDPSHGYIKSWVFRHAHNATSDDDVPELPTNLKESLEFANRYGNPDDLTESSLSSRPQTVTAVRPDPSKWNVKPYAYFAIGDDTGCTSNHFQNHHIIINLAFCGAVAGNLFSQDCPSEYEQMNTMWPKAACEAYVMSDVGRRTLEEEAYWKIRGVYLYQREKKKDPQ